MRAFSENTIWQLALYNMNIFMTNFNEYKTEVRIIGYAIPFFIRDRKTNSTR
jgi:hypothetical protein